MPVFIDLPEATVSSLHFQVAGWIATNSDEDEIGVFVNGREVPHAVLDRPALRLVPGLSHFGVAMGVVAHANLTNGDLQGDIAIAIRCGEEQTTRLVRWDEEVRGPLAFEESAAQAALREAARTWIEGRLRCPSCKADDSVLDVRGDALACRSCGSAFAQTTRALNMILPEMGLLSDVSPTSNVSSNPYTHDATLLIRETASAGGWVLDCGAGSRPERLPNVVNLEIVDYPCTDVLGIGESLPFKTGSFDAVVSLAVLEHVRDPFQCAREIMRVLKPGGVVRADVPFLQPSHGYPHHYYNMTKQGLENLFAGQGEILECKVPLHGQPILAVQWILSQYLLGLPPDARRDFARMTIGEAAALDPIHALTTGAPITRDLGPQAQEIIGCLNSILVRKTP